MSFGKPREKETKPRKPGGGRPKKNNPTVVFYKRVDWKLIDQFNRVAEALLKDPEMLAKCDQILTLRSQAQ